MRHTDALGLTGKLAGVVRFVLQARPQALRGSIHQYGNTVRFQVTLEGCDRQPSSPAAEEGLSKAAGASEAVEGRMRCWATSFPADQLDTMPERVSELAHGVFLDFPGIKGFRSPLTFRHYTAGLQHHLDYNQQKLSPFFKNAAREYELAIQAEGGNAEASCNLGELLYYKFTYDDNELAIKAYLGALKTETAAVRARAFRGLANAYCQRRQRHKRGGRASLEEAERWAKFASEFCQGKSKLPSDILASIKKAEAYVKQVWADVVGDQYPLEQERYLQEAERLYEAAIQLNDQFTVAYNNVSFLYLERAKKLEKQWRAGDHRNDDMREHALGHLKSAENWCARAISSDKTFHMAYDNAGNIYFTQAKLNPGDGKTLVELAVDSYHRAISYHPAYSEAHSDLARAQAKLFTMPSERRLSGHHACLSWQHHWDALSHTSDMGSIESMCRDFANLRDEFQLPEYDCIPIADDVERGHDLRFAAKVKCQCMAVEATL